MLVNRRDFLQGASATLALPSIARAAGTGVVRFVPYVDLSTLDPIQTTATATRNHAFLVYDTLYGLDTSFQAHPQMVEGHTIEQDGRRWTLRLRDGLRFHDNEPVLARDVVASIRRWATLDGFGQALMAATDELTASSDREVVFRLRYPFPQLPQALAKIAPSMCAIMPERLARTDARTQITEMVGSGPFRFVAAERIVGARNVYERFAGYVPCPTGPSSMTAGPKAVFVDRIEWTTMPDAATATAAIRQGEVDWLEAPAPDLLPLLRKEAGLEVGLKDGAGLTPILRFNCLQPPFDNPALRRAVLGSLDQQETMEAYSSDPSMYHVKSGVFCPGTPLATDAGMASLFGPTDVPRAKQALAAAGYKGERVAFLLPADHPIMSPLSTVAVDVFRRIGLNVDEQVMDTGTLSQRRNSRETLAKGGWSCFPSMVSGSASVNPVSFSALRSDGLAAWYGWPTSPSMERLRDAWLKEPDAAAQKAIATDIQLQAWQDATFIPFGQILQPMVWRRTLSGIPNGFAQFYRVRKS